jgi:hypothetical protein
LNSRAWSIPSEFDRVILDDLVAVDEILLLFLGQRVVLVAVYLVKVAGKDCLAG